MSNMPEEKYTATLADKLLYVSLKATQTVQLIAQLHADGIIDLDTYKKLYASANEVARLTSQLEEEANE